MQGSSEALEMRLQHTAADDSQIGGSWDDAKRFLIESRKQDLEISRDMERVNFYILSCRFIKKLDPVTAANKRRKYLNNI